MKKKYVAPESKLIALNLNESIAASVGDDVVGGMAVIQFKNVQDGCRELYTGRLSVSQNLPGTDFIHYYNDLMTKVKEQGAFEAYFFCFSSSQTV